MLTENHWLKSTNQFKCLKIKDFGVAYTGPGALVAVGYMDPGNWATSINGGQSFQFLLISTILLSRLMAMLLQNLSAKLGIVTQFDLAQAIRLHIIQNTADLSYSYYYFRCTVSFISKQDWL